ncbi:phage portal protein [Zavarzinella formosa]|uniref:phage portal protein n=1 Tax=Zavarzinella formosa TaxID=360055 RepID=UPI0002DBCEBA|nr:phage portal protein [Zavarzinella formosa]
MWPFRKDTPVPSRKSASFFVSLIGGKGALSGAAFDKLAREGYAECVVAFACINRIAAAVSSVEPHLYQKNRAGKLAKIESHPLLDLIYDPNPVQSWREFCGGLTAYHQLSGNAYVFGNGLDKSQKPPRELQLLSPGKVKIVPGRGLFPQGYEYRPDANTKFDYPVDQITGQSAILQIRSFNPLSPWYGLSPIGPAALGVDIHTGGQRWNKGLLDNGARPSGALSVKGGDGTPTSLTDDQYLRLKEMIDRQFSGGNNSGRPLLLEGGLEWQEMSLNPKDMDFLEGKNGAARDIALAFGVPPQLIGLPDSQTYANYSEAKTAFWTDTILPLLSMYMDAINRWLTPLYGDGLFLWYDEAGIPALEPMRNEKANRVNAASYMTINEKRREMGLDDIDGGDVVLVPFNDIPLELAGNSVHLAEPGSPADLNAKP